MRYLLTLCIAALAAIALLPMAGCIDSANGLTDTIVFMSEAPFSVSQTRVSTPWVWLMTANGLDTVPVYDYTAFLTAQGTLSPDGNQVIYVDRYYQKILDYDLATGNITTLYEGGANPGNPSFSPDGATIVFSNYGDIWTMSANGANPGELLNSGEDAYFNPKYNREGTKIVFQEGQDNGDSIYVMDANGTNDQVLASSGSNYQHPCFLPDGRILYTHVNVPTFTRASGWDIWIMDGDGGNKRNLTDSPGSDEFYPSCNYAGTAIAYGDGGQNGGDIYVVPFDGTDLGTPVNLTADNGNPCWHPEFGRVRTDLLQTIFSPPVM